MNEGNHCERIQYEDPSPYPELTVISPNAYYADLLYEDYSGKVSELTACCQYEYHYIYNCKQEERRVHHLRKIARVEQKHLEMIGELITLLGGYPVFQRGFDAQRSFWSAKQVQYGRELTEQLKLDLEMEYRTICNYNTHIKMINDPYIKNILRRIIKDEYVHATVLQTLIRGDC